MGSTQYSKRVPQRMAKARRPRQRSKTFATKELAQAYAKKQGIEKFEIEQVNTHKFRIKAA